MSSLVEQAGALERRLEAIERNLAAALSRSANSSGPGSRWEVPETWHELEMALRHGKPVLVDRVLTVGADTLIQESAEIRFTARGAWDFSSGHRVKLNTLPENPGNYWIFRNVEIDESYQGKWNESKGSTLTGSFGGVSTRKAAWWGCQASDYAHRATEEFAERNNRAIMAAALSRPYVSGGPIPVEVVLPLGRIPIHRTIRLDGLRVSLRGGQGAQITGTELYGYSEVWKFDESHFITTSMFPSGTVPVVEIGFERQPDLNRNIDEGFQCGVHNLVVRCPLSNEKPVSGIMAESGLQEVSDIGSVSIVNYSGYGLGMPDRQHQRHNDPQPAGHMPQVNTVVFHRLWIHSPNPRFPAAVGVALHGLNMELRNCTIHHHDSKKEIHWGPAVVASSRECVRISQLHVEHNPPKNMTGACVLIPADGGAGRVSVDGLFCWLAGNVDRTKFSEAVRIENPLASVTLSNVHHRTGTTIPALDDTCRTVNDVPRGKISERPFKQNSGKCLAFYARQYLHDLNGQYGVSTTDPGMA